MDTVVNQGMPCMNCKEPVEQTKAKVFAEVFLCPRCFTVAEAIYNRSLRELKAVLILLKDVIRERLIRGELQFPERQPDELSRADVLKTIVRLQELFDASRGRSHAGDPANEPEGDGDRRTELLELGDGASTGKGH